MQKRVDTQEQNTKEKSASGISMRSRLLLALLQPQRWQGRPKKTSSKATKATPNKCIWDLENEG